MEISLDIILKGFKNQCENFKSKEFFEKCKKEYPILNKGYEFIEPFNVSLLEQGDIIRYIKNIGQVINSPCYIFKIKYVGIETIQGKTFIDKNKCYIEYIETKLLRKSNAENSVDKLRIYPENYFFFRLIEKKGKNNKIIRELFNDNTFNEIVYKPFKKTTIDNSNKLDLVNDNSLVSDNSFDDNSMDDNLEDIDNIMKKVKDIITPFSLKNDTSYSKKM